MIPKIAGVDDLDKQRPLKLQEALKKVTGANFSFLGGSDGERHQAAVAEARRHLGGGGKRGWLA